ncbi:MAG TPA: NUDIX hydrolase [Ktedonobacteraceae bacterium]|nr:NUDIX hydrolase [Ktedonobacteraceae bacterium]
MLEFDILARGLYSRDQLDITYNPLLHMAITPSIQQWMDTLWQQKLAIAREKGTRLFDSQLFRLEQAAASPDGTLHLVLGNTSYKEYVTTREPDYAHGHSRPELSNALSVCSVVETSDDYILLDKREGVDTYVGRYHVIGGFFERALDSTSMTSMTGMSSKEVQPDPFAAITREIREETGIQPADIREQYCLGTVYDLTLPHCELCFLTRLNIPLQEVHTRVPEEDEIKQLHTLHVTKESLRDFIFTNHGNISPTGEPNLLMYGAVKFGEGWWDEVMQLLAI